MPCGEVNFDITPQPEKHMFECQYITMVAVMLAFPMWRKPPYVPGDWPPPDEVERARHGLEKQLIQFNVGPSVMDDELGLSYETLAISGLYLASEPEFLDTLRHRCLMCGKAFFTQWKFVDHLQQHNFCQLDTYMCYHRLQLRSLETVGHPCHFCAQFEHATSLGKICVPLLHLAIFLCNGSPGLPSRRNLEGCLDPRSDGCTGDQHTGLPAAQASQGRPLPKKTSGSSSDALLQLVARLALRTEDTLNQVLQEHQFVMHLQPGPDSIFPILLGASQKWHREEKTMPLRQLLSSMLVQTLLAKVETLANTQQTEQL
jgi:hypothetical protein